MDGLTPEQMKIVKKSYLMECLCVGALIQAIFMYALVLHMSLKGQSVAIIPPDVSQLRMIFMILTPLNFFASWMFKKILLKNKATISKNEVNQESVQKIYAKKIVAVMFSAACCEAVALYGLVLAFSSRNAVDFYTFAVPALGGLIYYFPRFSQWKAWIR